MKTFTQFISEALEFEHEQKDFEASAKNHHKDLVKDIGKNVSIHVEHDGNQSFADVDLAGTDDKAVTKHLTGKWGKPTKFIKHIDEYLNMKAHNPVKRFLHDKRTDKLTMHGWHDE